MSDAENTEPKFEALVSQRVTAELKDEIKAIYRDFRINEADLVRIALPAICAYIRTRGGFRGPVKMVLASEREPHAFAAEYTQGSAAHAVNEEVTRGLTPAPVAPQTATPSHSASKPAPTPPKH